MSVKPDIINNQLFILENLVAGEKAMIRACGESMYPTIKNNDEIIFIKCKETEYKKGDIIIFRNRDIISAHRIIRRNADNSFCCKGDNCLKYDDPVETTNLLAKVIGKNKNFGYFSTTSQLVKTLFVLTFPIFSALIFHSFFRIIQPKR